MSADAAGIAKSKNKKVLVFSLERGPCYFIVSTLAFRWSNGTMQRGASVEGDNSGPSWHKRGRSLTSWPISDNPAAICKLSAMRNAGVWIICRAGHSRENSVLLHSCLTFSQLCCTAAAQQLSFYQLSLSWSSV